MENGLGGCESREEQFCNAISILESATTIPRTTSYPHLGSVTHPLDIFFETRIQPSIATTESALDQILQAALQQRQHLRQQALLNLSASILSIARSSAVPEFLYGGPYLFPPCPPARILDPCPPPTQTLQDYPMSPPVYNGVNPNYPGLRVLNNSPPMFTVDNFLTSFECDFLIQAAQDSFMPAPVVGKGAGEISPSRTSSTCYLMREDVPDVMRKVSHLTGKPVEHFELPQVGRYQPSQQYLQHYDAFDLGTEDGRRFAANGGQRIITVLIYLNDVYHGGATRFPMLNLEVQPRRGTALIFFPATIDGLLDKMALHAALPAIDVKYVSQIWIRQSVYQGQPSKRLSHTLGVPFGHSPPASSANQIIVTPPSSTEAALWLQYQQQQQQHHQQQNYLQQDKTPQTTFF